MACLQIYRELLSLTTFLRVHSNSKEVSYLSRQNTYPNLKTTCHIKLKFFLWTKLLENLLLAKYLISVTSPLIVITVILISRRIIRVHSVICRNLPIFVLFVNNFILLINVEKLQTYLKESLFSVKMVAVFYV